MKTFQAWSGSPAVKPHEVEIDGRTVAAFWRLGRVLATGAPRDREVFTLGRCIGSTPGTTATLHAFGEHDDPAAFAMSRLIYGGEQLMQDAYWQTVDNPVVFDLARQVYELLPDAGDELVRHDAGGELIFDVGADHARLAAIRFRVPEAVNRSDR